MTFKVVVITASDSGYAGKREDLSGEKVIEICQKNQLQVVKKIILPDEATLLSQAMKQIADQEEADLILTTGGTGLAPRDCTPEATLAIADRLVPGFSEAMRSLSLQITKRAMLSRGVSVTRKATLIINLPGSTKSVDESLSYIIDQIPHALALLKDQKKASENHFEK